MTIQKLNKHSLKIILSLFFALNISQAISSDIDKEIHLGLKFGITNDGKGSITSEISTRISISKIIECGINQNILIGNGNISYNIGPCIRIKPSFENYIPFIETSYQMGKDWIKTTSGEVYFTNSSSQESMFENVYKGSAMLFLGFTCNYWDSRISLEAKYGFGYNHYSKEPINDSFEMFYNHPITKSLLIGLSINLSAKRK